MTEDKKYTRNDLLKEIEDMFPNCYARQAGCLKGVLASVLISVEVRAPELFKDIIDFEMRTTKSLKD